jgi:hypothetical protein
VQIKQKIIVKSKGKPPTFGGQTFALLLLEKSKKSNSKQKNTLI